MRSRGSSSEGVFAAFARTLEFPGYFGRNWDAMVDCLDDLHGSWHGGRAIAVVIGDAEDADFASRLIGGERCSPRLRPAGGGAT